MANARFSPAIAPDINHVMTTIIEETVVVVLEVCCSDVIHIDPGLKRLCSMLEIGMKVYWIGEVA